MIIDSKYVYALCKIWHFELKVKVKRLSYSDFMKIASLLEIQSVKSLQEIIEFEKYDNLQKKIDPNRQWILASLLINFNHLPKKIALWLSIFVLQTCNKDFFILKAFNEGVLIYLDSLLDHDYRSYFEKDKKSNAENILNNLKNKKMLELVYAKNNIDINRKMSWIEHYLYNDNELIKTGYILNGLSFDKKENEVIYPFLFMKYLKDAKSLVNSYGIECDNIFNNDVEKRLKKRIGKAWWGRSERSKKYIWAKYNEKLPSN